MKKFCFATLLVISIVILAGCKAAPKAESNDKEAIFTNEELYEISAPLIESSIDAYEKIMCCEFEVTKKEKLISGFDYIHHNSLRWKIRLRLSLSAYCYNVSIVCLLFILSK